MHLEVVFNLISKTFSNALKRFIARRGKPTRIISDNATTFKGAKWGLDKAWSLIRENEDSLNYFTNEKILWDFITEYAPWKGGFYERMIGLVKNCQKKTIKRRVLLQEEITNLSCEVEAVIDSRPLTFIYDEPNSMVLRPIDFIQPHLKLGQYTLRT